MSIDAMKQALEALEDCREGLRRAGAMGELLVVNAAITALRAAIEQAERQEPVGEVLNERGDVDYLSYVPPAGTPLYTAPPAAQRTWVGLTDEEIEKTCETQVWDARRSYARAIEAKLKEKNT